MESIIRNRTAYTNSEAPSDWIMGIKEVALNASGFAVIDFTGKVRPGTVVKYVLLSSTNVWGSGTKSESESLDVYKGQALIGTSASTQTDMDDYAVNVIPAASAQVTILYFYQQTDQAQHGESFV